MIYRIYKKIVCRLGWKQEPEKYELFSIDVGDYWHDILDIEAKLVEHGYFYNDLSSMYRGQIYTGRKLVDHNYQIHIRIYKTGIVTGHFEARTEHPSAHLTSVGYRLLYPQEIDELVQILNPISMAPIIGEKCT